MTVQCATPDQVAYLKSLMAQLEARGQDTSMTRKNMNLCWTQRVFDVGFADVVIKSMSERITELDMIRRAKS